MGFLDISSPHPIQIPGNQNRKCQTWATIGGLFDLCSISSFQSLVPSCCHESKIDDQKDFTKCVRRPLWQHFQGGGAEGVAPPMISRDGATEASYKLVALDVVLCSVWGMHLGTKK